MAGWGLGLALSAALAAGGQAQVLHARIPAAAPSAGLVIQVQGSPFGASDVVSLLRSQGFRDISAVTQRGKTFTAEATSPNGDRMRLVVSNGVVVGARVIGHGRRP